MDQTSKALTQVKDLAKLRAWLLDQLELDHELLLEGQINNFKSYGDSFTVVPYYEYLNDHKDMMATLHVVTVNTLTNAGVDSKVFDKSDTNFKRPLNHLALLDRVKNVLAA